MKIGVVLLGLVFLVSCKKPENRSCFKSWGTETTREINLPAFHSLYLKEHMEFILIQDSLNKVVVLAGENMVNLIKAEVSDDGVLSISNKNKCRFLRNKKKVVQVEIHFTSLEEIHFEGTEPMSNKGVISFNAINLVIRDGAGSVNLNLNANNIEADVTAGNGDYTLNGTAHHAKISAQGTSYCDVTGLIVQDSIEVISSTVGPMKVNANGIKMYGYQKSSGNIYYSGTPQNIQVLQTGTGKILPL